MKRTLRPSPKEKGKKDIWSSSRSKLQKLGFALSALFLPSQLAFHFWPDWAKIFGLRIDYFSPTVYLTDLLILLLFAVSIKEFAGLRRYLKPLVLILFFATLNIYFSSRWEVALYKWIKLGEFSLLAYLTYRKWREVREVFVKALLASLFYTAVIATLQFINGGTSGGVFSLLGERSFHLSTPGIALTSFLGREYLRPYATFPHPNVMAGFALVSLFLIFSTKINKSLRSLAFALSAFLIVISASLGAFIVFLFSVTLFAVIKKPPQRLFLAVPLLATLWSLLFLVYAHSASRDLFLSESWGERLALARASGVVFAKSPGIGVGLGNFILSLTSLGTKTYFLQPVHNLFLLILAETGLVGLLVFNYLIFKSFENLVRRGRWPLVVGFLSIILTGLLDHYWLTLEQTELLFAVVIGASFSQNTKDGS